jgi:hypothetical protein
VCSSVHRLHRKPQRDPRRLTASGTFLIRKASAGWPTQLCWRPKGLRYLAVLGRSGIGGSCLADCTSEADDEQGGERPS